MKSGISGSGLLQQADVRRNRGSCTAEGSSSYRLAEHATGGLDALTVLSIFGHHAGSIELGAAVSPTWPRHPLTLANQTLNTAGVIGHRLTLGVSLSHASIVADLGNSFEKPIDRLREYLSILMPLLRSGTVEFDGEVLS